MKYLSEDAVVSKRSINQINPWLIRVSIVSTIVYLLWRIFFTMPLRNGIVSMVVASILLIAEIVGSLVSNIQYFEALGGAEPKLPDIPLDWYPNVDVFIATHSEPTELLLKTINGCVHMDYPDKGKVHIWVCDDGDRPEMAELAASMGVGYFGLSGNKDMKAGNLNNALSKTNAPLVVTFDADMIPTRLFLMKTVPYFYLPKLKINDSVWSERKPGEIDEKYKIGFVQTPQSFYNADLFQYNLFSENRFPNEQDYFYRNILINRNASNSAIYGGSNTVIARTALEEIGGFVTGTITEDYATGIRIQRKGWTTYATSEPLAHGLSVDNFNGLIKQRARWGRGVVYSTMKEGALTAKEFSLGAKLGYFCCFMYWHTFSARLVYILAPILSVLFSLHIVECTIWQALLIWFPSYVLNAYILKKSSSQVRTSHLSNTVDTIMSPYMLLPITAEQFGIRMKSFVVTDKSHAADDKSFFYALPHMVMLLASILSFALVIPPILQGNYGSVIIAFWLFVNGKNLILAIMFMLGRRNYRATERFYVSVPVEIDSNRKIIHGQTLDISEEGMAVELITPEYIPPDAEVKVTVTYSAYKAELMANLVHVENRNAKWKYCLIITEMDEENRMQYLQIVYDRHHSLSNKIIDNWSIFDDFSLNIKKRVETLQSFQRKLPRMAAAIPLDIGGQEGIVTSFNYRYITVNLPTGVAAGNIREMSIGGLKVITKESHILPYNNETLIEISNYDELLDNPLLDDFVNSLLDGTSSTLKWICPFFIIIFCFFFRRILQ